MGLQSHKLSLYPQETYWTKVQSPTLLVCLKKKLMFSYIIILSNYNEKKLHYCNIGKTLLLFLYNSAKQISKRKQMNYALITGSSGTIGEAITRKVLALGYHVVGVSRHNSFSDYKHNSLSNACVSLRSHAICSKLLCL